MPDEAIVTLKDVYQAVQTLQQGVVKIESEVHTAVTARADHEDRIRTLEKWMYALPPTFLLAAASIVVALLK